MDEGGFSRHTVSVIGGPRFYGTMNKPTRPRTSFLWRSIIVHAIGTPAWADKFVQALPSQAEMQADGADAEGSLEDLVTDARTAIWENGGNCIHLNKDHIRKLDDGTVYFGTAFQDGLIERLEGKASYDWAQRWIQSRFDKATTRNLRQVHFPMHYRTSSQHIASCPAAMPSCTYWFQSLILYTCGLPPAHETDTRALGGAAGGREPSAKQRGGG